MSKHINCPNCNTSFTIDESQYAQILSQVRGEELEQEVARRLEAAAIQSKLEQEQAVTQLREKAVKHANEQKAEIAELRAKLQAFEQDKQLAVTLMSSAKELELNQLKAEKDMAVTDLKNQLVSLQQQQQHAVEKVASEKDTQLMELKFQLESKDKELALEKNALSQSYEQQLKLKDDHITQLSDYKSRLSTKMVGESLEQHCEVSFESLRSIFPPTVQFGKDNDASGGSKGDYIYREFDTDGEEILSIMFEMKNENDTTSTKKKNEHFFKELDKDRTQKKCEYAVLVSLLESDNELYNSGIVDVHQHDKMYVVRPQFFIPIIKLLRDAALKTLHYKKEITAMKQQNIDVTNFEAEMEAFKTNFGRNVKDASNNFDKAIKEIDESIKRLENTKKALELTITHFNRASNKSEDLSIKKLTKNNPTMRDKFAEVAMALETQPAQLTDSEVVNV